MGTRFYGGDVKNKVGMGGNTWHHGGIIIVDNCDFVWFLVKKRRKKKLTCQFFVVFLFAFFFLFPVSISFVFHFFFFAHKIISNNYCFRIFRLSPYFHEFQFHKIHTHGTKQRGHTTLYTQLITFTTFWFLMVRLLVLLPTTVFVTHTSLFKWTHTHEKTGQ